MQRQGLHRSRKDRVFGGVAGGIARSLNTDPAIVRLIFALMIIVGGGGLLLYLILWIAIPEEPLEFFQENAAGVENPVNEAGSADSPYAPPLYPPRRNNGALIVGLVLIGIGILFLVDRFLPNIRIHFHELWPIIIVIAGIALIFSSFSGIKKT